MSSPESQINYERAKAKLEQAKAELGSNLTFKKIMLDLAAESSFLFIIPLAFLFLNRLYSILSPNAEQILARVKTSDWVVLVFLLLLILFVIINNYLQNDKKPAELSKTLSERLRKLGELQEIANEETRQNQSSLEKPLNLSENSEDFSDEQRRQIQEAVVNSVALNLSAGFFDELKNSIKSQIAEDKKINLAVLIKRAENSANRLKDEIAQLSRRANINLAIGSTITIAAVVALSYFVLHEKFDSADLKIVAVHFIPRLSLVLFVEFFSFFFLKLYRANLHEIKYYQNEITNLEVNITAIEFVVNYGNGSDVSALVKEMALTERNFKLQKDESTVELERSKAETHDLKEVLKAALGGIKKDK